MLKTIPEIAQQIRQSVNTVSAEQAFSACKENNGIILDVREPAEVAQKPIADTVNIPRGVLEMKMLERYPNAELVIYIHCATGIRATFSAEQLMRLGYQNVSIITCKIDDVYTSSNKHR